MSGRISYFALYDKVLEVGGGFRLCFFFCVTFCGNKYVEYDNPIEDCVFFFRRDGAEAIQ